jgi:hypothetical protein
MSSDPRAARVIIAAIGFFLMGKLLVDYFSRPSRLLEHPNPRVPQLNRLRVYTLLIALGAVALGAVGFRFGLPGTGVLILLGIAVVAVIIYLVCTFWVVAITGHL